MKFSTVSWIPLFAVVVLLSSCKNEEPGMAAAESPRDKAMTMGHAMSCALMKNLSLQLKAALESGGPVSAVHVCQQAAMPITESTNDQFAGATIRRTSLKTRNPANASDELDRQILEAWEKLKGEGKALPEGEVTAVSNEGGLRYYRPILVQAACLKCHGDEKSFSPELLDVLNNEYPNDQARGYREGELRGAFRVTMK
jgi:hypothetical protein